MNIPTFFSWNMLQFTFQVIIGQQNRYGVALFTLSPSRYTGSSGDLAERLEPKAWWIADSHASKESRDVWYNDVQRRSVGFVAIYGLKEFGCYRIS